MWISPQLWNDRPNQTYLKDLPAVLKMKLGHEIRDSRDRWPELTDELLDELQLWCRARSLPKVPLEQLALFAHSSYCNKADTIKCMETYYRMRATVPDFFANRDPLHDTLQYTLKAVWFIRLPKPDRQGNRIIFHGLRDSSPSHYVFNDSVKLLFMTMDASLYDDGCVPGHTFLFDMNKVRLTHLMRVPLLNLKKFFEFLQEGMPVRLKAIHVLNCTWFMDKVLALVRPFMKKELLDILHLHTGDVSDVYEYISPDSLPKDFGGKLEDLETFQAEHTRKLIELREYFKEEERLYRGFSECSQKSKSIICDAHDKISPIEEDKDVKNECS